MSDRMNDQDYLNYEKFKIYAEQYNKRNSVPLETLHVSDKSPGDYAPEEQSHNRKESANKKSSFKERIVASLGILGVLLYLLIRLIVSVLPFVMIDGNFFVTLVLIGINTIVPFASVIFWTWGLVCAINGVQDIWAILYYIVFVVVWIPFYISVITSFFKRKFNYSD